MPEQTEPQRADLPPNDDADGPRGTRSSSLPRAELNPLLNPILSRNLGRWAEVYFTASPEHREQAVVELLRELQGQASPPADDDSYAHDRSNIGAVRSLAGNGATASTQAESASTGDPPQSGSVSKETELPIDVCRSCGHENHSGRQFCGMCGLPLGEESQVSERPVHEETSERYGADFPDDRLDHIFRAATPPPSYRFRVLIAAIVVLLGSYLLYGAWHSGQLAAKLSQVKGQQGTAQAPSQPTANTIPQPTSTRQSSPPVRASGAKDNASSEAAPRETHEAAADSRPSIPKDAARARRRNSSARRHKKTPVPVPAAEKDLLTHDPGVEDLAIARNYLNGSNGKKRDAAQAVALLWLAVSKKNTDATVLLSDLYLRGDGVTKSCEQARVLLHAAAARGRRDATDRLRHLPAYGCR